MLWDREEIREGEQAYIHGQMRADDDDNDGMAWLWRPGRRG